MVKPMWQVDRQFLDQDLKPHENYESSEPEPMDVE